MRKAPLARSAGSNPVKPPKTWRKSSTLLPSSLARVAASIPSMTTAELAYTAGILDGEGSISICRAAKQWPRLEVAIASTDLELLVWLKERWGGRLVKKKVYQPHHRDSWMLHFTFLKAAAFLEAVEPYLVIERKKARCRAGINYARSASRNGRYTDRQRIEREHLLALFV